MELVDVVDSKSTGSNAVPVRVRPAAYKIFFLFARKNCDKNKDKSLKLHINLGKNSYDVFLKRGGLNEAGKLFNLDRKVLIVTDDGVPSQYAKIVAEQCRDSVCVTLPQGERTKSFFYFELLCKKCLEAQLTRNDCIVAVGGGVVGDLVGFTAASYMRGIDFYNIPTTVLSQVDSSIGGKVAINLDNIKNIVGAFYQPRGVVIDPDILKTLPLRQFSNGLAEAIKMGLIWDEKLFYLFEKENPMDYIDEIIWRSLKAKQFVVQKDEYENGLRRILNFGHTIGHGIESCGKFYHGECVALGMIPMCTPSIRKRLLSVLKKFNLPTQFNFDKDVVLKAIFHDKKSNKDLINMIFVEEIGKAVQKTIKKSELYRLLEKYNCSEDIK